MAYILAAERTLIEQTYDDAFRVYVVLTWADEDEPPAYNAQIELSFIEGEGAEPYLSDDNDQEFPSYYSFSTDRRAKISKGTAIFKVNKAGCGSLRVNVFPSLGLLAPEDVIIKWNAIELPVVDATSIVAE